HRRLAAGQRADAGDRRGAGGQDGAGPHRPRRGGRRPRRHPAHPRRTLCAFPGRPGGAAMRTLLIIAMKEIREGLRNRWVLAVTLLLAALALTLSFLGSAPTGTVGAGAL